MALWSARLCCVGWDSKLFCELLILITSCSEVVAVSTGNFVSVFSHGSSAHFFGLNLIVSMYGDDQHVVHILSEKKESNSRLDVCKMMYYIVINGEIAYIQQTFTSHMVWRLGSMPKGAKYCILDAEIKSGIQRVNNCYSCIMNSSQAKLLPFTVQGFPSGDIKLLGAEFPFYKSIWLGLSSFSCEGLQPLKR